MPEEKKKEIPESCFKCDYAYYCHAPYYGSTLCKYRVEIDKRYIDRVLQREKGG